MREKNDTRSLSTKVYSRLTINHIQTEIKEVTLCKKHESGTNKD